MNLKVSWHNGQEYIEVYSNNLEHAMLVCTLLSQALQGEQVNLWRRHGEQSWEMVGGMREEKLRWQG